MPLQFPTLDTAIGQAEGFGKPGTIPTLANNPGDLVAGPFSTAHGAIGSITAAGGKQIAVFPSADQGTAAQDALIANNYAGGSIADLARSWLGSDASQQSVDSYAGNLSSALGVPASTPVTSLAGGGSPSTSGVASPSIISKVGSAVANVVSYTIFGLPLTRAAAFLLGLIVIGVALFLFKPTQQVIVSAAKKGAAAATVAA